MLSSKTKLEEIVSLVPEWASHLERLQQQSGASQPVDLFQALGAKAMFAKLRSQKQSAEKERLILLIRDCYFQPLLAKMLESNSNLRRFWVQRHLMRDEQKQHAVSMSLDLAEKLQQALNKQLSQGAEDGFKVLLPAYIQRSVHNAAVDHIRNEWQWEKDTLQDLNLDPDQVDPRINVADDPKYCPENVALSGEQVGQLNQLRERLATMLEQKNIPQEPLVVVDCMFGLGLTEKSKTGVEMTMRECCDVLNIQGETQARKIARCQVLLDKGLDMIREMIRLDMPGVADSWQSDINVNTASRRELNHHLGLTEGEVDRLIAGRQYYTLQELVDRRILQANRLSEVAERGAVAAFVPVDLNSATKRDLVDILGADKDAAKKLAEMRPFHNLNEIVERGILSRKDMEKLIANGAVLRSLGNGEHRVSLNHATKEELLSLGFSQDHAARLIRARPFGTWNELEDFLCLEGDSWRNIRNKSCLTILSR